MTYLCCVAHSYTLNVQFIWATDFRMCPWLPSAPIELPLVDDDDDDDDLPAASATTTTTTTNYRN